MNLCSIWSARPLLKNLEKPLLSFHCLFVFAAIEGSGMGGMKLPIGMTRRALSYDDNLEAPMSTPPHDISINNLWRRPIIPERKFSHLAEVDVHRLHNYFILTSLIFTPGLSSSGRTCCCVQKIMFVCFLLSSTRRMRVVQPSSLQCRRVSPPKHQL